MKNYIIKTYGYSEKEATEIAEAYNQITSNTNSSLSIHEFIIVYKNNIMLTKKHSFSYALPSLFTKKGVFGRIGQKIAFHK